jgi:hypothetical protein
VAARSWRFAAAADNFGGAVVEVCLEGVGFRRFGEVTVKAHGIGDRLAPLATTGDVFGAVVPVRDDVNVQASAVVIATAADLCDRVERP